MKPPRLHWTQMHPARSEEEERRQRITCEELEAMLADFDPIMERAQQRLATAQREVEQWKSAKSAALLALDMLRAKREGRPLVSEAEVQPDV